VVCLLAEQCRVGLEGLAVDGVARLSVLFRDPCSGLREDLGPEVIAGDVQRRAGLTRELRAVARRRSERSPELSNVSISGIP
jgi:hypothetical protein